jgi:6,7-dimethyl-8-ribityllumazine synthase
MARPGQAANEEERDLAGARVLIVEARFYQAISDALFAGAARVLEEAGVGFERIAVPGALEVPAAIAIALDAAQRQGRPYEGAVALGCVIRGETSHYEIVAGESARALMDLSVARLLPIGNGILTVDTQEQAFARAKPGEWDKGAAAARAALALIRIKRQVAARG